MGGQPHHRSEDIVLTLATKMLRSFGELRPVVRGASMVPTLFPGDVLVVRRESARTARQGDVMLLFRQGFFCAHRLVSTGEAASARLITRGDALPQDDPPFGEDELVGRVTSVIRRGKRIELDRVTSRMSHRLLRRIVRRSQGSVKWMLRWHSLRSRLSHVRVCAGDQNRWQPEVLS